MPAFAGMSGAVQHIKDNPMAPRPLADKDWPRIRTQYEHTDMLLPEICAEHRISVTTLNNRAPVGLDAAARAGTGRRPARRAAAARRNRAALA